MKRFLASILTVCLFLSIPAFSNADHQSDYERALSMAGNDLTDLNALQSAVDILRQLGTYRLSKS